MQHNYAIDTDSQSIIQRSRELIHEPSFCQRHRANRKCFTRRRVLTFMNVMIFALRKSIRSLQLRLHDFFEDLCAAQDCVKAPSWCEARMKLKHTAFIELNERAILEVIYPSGGCGKREQWKGHRLLAIDSSLVRLPNQAALGEEFGWVENSNKEGSCGKFPQARLSVLADVLNRVVLQALFVPWRQGERSLALEHLEVLAPEDITITDRGYASYEMWAQFVARQRGFVCRCPASNFSVVNELFKENQAGRSVEAILRPSANKRAEIIQAGLPQEIRVRFVTVRLSSGELEVLATNLFDEERYPTQEFGQLYYFRWGVETYYGLIKGRLDLQHFTGLSVEAVRQDVHATIFLSNLESVLVKPVQEELHQRSQGLKHRQQVNHAVSFHALKDQIIALLLSSKPIEEVLTKLQDLFAANPVSHRPARQVARKKQSAWGSYHFQRNVKKSVF